MSFIIFQLTVPASTLCNKDEDCGVEYILLKDDM